MKTPAGTNEPTNGADEALDTLVKSAEGLVDAAVALCAVKIEAAGKDDWRRAAVLRSLAASVEIPYDAGDLGTAASMALMVIATLSRSKRARAAKAVADVLGGAAEPRPVVRLGSPRFRVVHPN